MTPLTDDEFTLLLIAKEGESLAAIGRWEKSVDHLVEQGLLLRQDKFNNTITAKGITACEERENDDARAMVEVSTRDMGKAQEVQARIQDFIQQAAQLLAEASKTSALLTGDNPKLAAKRWAIILLERTIELL